MERAVSQPEGRDTYSHLHQMFLPPALVQRPQPSEGPVMTLTMTLTYLGI